MDHKANRHSGQTWLHAQQHPVVAEVLQRAAGFLELPLQAILHQSEPLQVVRYGRRGHYACHTDTTEGYLHRRLTLLVFLNDDFKGGELAFPYAGRNISDLDWEELKIQCLPAQQCSSADGALVVVPKAGDAILWYNMEGDSEQRRLVRESMHSGCPVRKGTKWIANLWISAFS